ncbi:MAG: SPOR domain-containing protein [Alphaproteobacteria bacterium]|nr:SPOR domain-containing protein [Alphaproteobacteria bacterium]
MAAEPAAKAVEAGYRIQLVSLRTAKRADAAWRSLEKAHADILGNLAGHTARVNLGKRGIYYRVQAGFFANEALARAACGKLKAKRQDCIIVPPQ